MTRAHKKMNAFDVVMPLHPAKGDRLDLLRAASAVASFSATGSDALVSNIFIIYPEGHKLLLAGLTDLSDKVVLIAEETLFSPRELRAIRTGSGWRRQQFLKLCAPRIASSDVIMTCDADVVCLRKLESSDIEYRGKIRMQRGKQFPQWVNDSFKLCGVMPPEKVMSVTPAFLTREGLKNVAAKLGHGSRDWIERLVDAEQSGSEWTEYMVYQAANIRAGHWDEAHVMVRANALHEGVWRNHNADGERIDTIKENSPPFFVYQSVRGDFFWAQRQLSHFDICNFLDVSASVRLRLTTELLILSETQRYWEKNLQSHFGKFQSRFFDFLQAPVRGTPLQEPSAVFEALATLLFIAISILERAHGAPAFKITVRNAIEKMQDFPFMAEAISTSEEFQALTALLMGQARIVPAGLPPLLFTAEISQPTLSLLFDRLSPLLPAEMLAEILVSRMKYAKTPPARTTAKVVRQLHEDASWAVALRLLRYARRRYDRREDIEELLFSTWVGLGRSEAAKRLALEPAHGSR